VNRALAFALILGLAPVGAPLAAQTPSLSARLDPDHLSAGDLAVLQITIGGSMRIQGSPELALQNLEVAAGPSLENRFEWINGKSSSRTILLYRLRALKPGPASVGPIRVVGSAGQTLEAPQLTAIVEKSAQRPGEPRSAPVSSDPALVARIDPARPYSGQQAIWTLFLVTRGRATQGEIKSLPDFKGFWAEDLDREQNVSPQLWNVGGEIWRAYPMIRKALFANRAAAIPVGTARAVIAIRSDLFDLFGDSPFSDSRPVERESAPISAVVRSVPANAVGLPVGNFVLKVSVDRNDIPPGGSFSVMAALSGDGRLADVLAPGLEISGARVSEPEARLSIRRNAQKLLSTRTWQWVVTPERPGALTIPVLRIATFNPGPGRVVEAASSPLSVRAAGLAAPPPERAEAPRPAMRPARSFPAPALLAPVLAALAVLSVAVGYRLGRARRVPPEATALEASPEKRIEKALDALAERSGRRGGAGESEVARLRGEFARVAFSPHLSSREEAFQRLEEEVRRLAKRWRIRV
jgi:BatD DUF11 like domain